MSNYFQELNSINVQDKTSIKGKFTYLSWAFAWAEVKKLHPDASYIVHKFGEDRKPYLFDEDLGYMVFTEVTINEITHEMWLPVMNFRNQAMQKGDATMMDINKTIMRCLVKNIGMHGLGLYIYAGEDLPEEDNEPRRNKQQDIATVNKKMQDLVSKYQSKEKVYELLKLEEGQFLELYKNEPHKIIELIDKHVKS